MDLFNNEISNIEDYRKKVFELLPSLKYLDGFDIEENEAESGAEDGANGTLEDDDDDDGKDSFFPQKHSTHVNKELPSSSFKNVIILLLC